MEFLCFPPQQIIWSLSRPKSSLQRLRIVSADILLCPNVIPTSKYTTRHVVPHHKIQSVPNLPLHTFALNVMDAALKLAHVHPSTSHTSIDTSLFASRPVGKNAVPKRTFKWSVDTTYPPHLYASQHPPHLYGHNVFVWVKTNLATQSFPFLHGNLNNSNCNADMDENWEKGRAQIL